MEDAQLMLIFCFQEIFGTEPLISVFLAVNLLGFWWTFTVGFRVVQGTLHNRPGQSYVPVSFVSEGFEILLL